MSYMNAHRHVCVCATSLTARSDAHLWQIGKNRPILCSHALKHQSVSQLYVQMQGLF